jgi:hypothetical protein
MSKLSDGLSKAVTNAQAQAAGTANVPEGALMAFRSHIEGRNATVTVFPDRIEWTRNRLMGRRDTNTIMMRSVTGIKTHKSGLTYTEVEIVSGASSVVMRVSKAQAENLRRVVTQHSQQ